MVCPFKPVYKLQQNPFGALESFITLPLSIHFLLPLSHASLFVYIHSTRLALSPFVRKAPQSPNQDFASRDELHLILVTVNLFLPQPPSSKEPDIILSLPVSFHVNYNGQKPYSLHTACFMDPPAKSHIYAHGRCQKAGLHFIGSVFWN